MTPDERKEARRLSVKRYNDKTKEQRKLYYEENKEKIKQRNLENKEKKTEYNKKYYSENTEREKQRVSTYRRENPDKIKEYRIKSSENRNNWEKNKRLTDETFRLKQNIRSLIRASFKRSNKTKPSSSEIILGCSFEAFKTYLESKFESWMNWDNYGLYNGEPNYGWDLDHVIPLSSAKTIDELILLNHHTNLQPLCSHTNRNIKRNNHII